MCEKIDPERFTAIARLLSGQGGEKVNALEKLNAMLARAGITWSDLVIVLPDSVVHKGGAGLNAPRSMRTIQVLAGDTFSGVPVVKGAREAGAMAFFSLQLCDYHRGVQTQPVIVSGSKGDGFLAFLTGAAKNRQTISLSFEEDDDGSLTASSR